MMCAIRLLYLKTIIVKDLDWGNILHVGGEFQIDYFFGQLFEIYTPSVEYS